MRESISAIDTAKIIRGELKSNFPGVKFSVKCDKYTGGASIHIAWTDGATKHAVESVIAKFKGKSFNGMDDSSEYLTGKWQGKDVHFGADHISCTREYSPEKQLDAAQKTVAYWGLDVTAQEIVAARNNGTLWQIAKQHLPSADMYVLDRHFREQAEEMIETAESEVQGSHEEEEIQKESIMTPEPKEDPRSQKAHRTA